MCISFNVEVVFYSDVYAAGMLAGSHAGPPLKDGSIYHPTFLSWHFVRGSGAQVAADRLQNVPCLREAVGSVNSHYHIYNLGHSHWILLVARCDTMTVDVFDGMLSRTFDGCRTDAYRTDVMAAANHFAHYLYTVTGNETFNTFEINLHGKELMWQRDGTSCGVFACIAMEHLVSEAAIRIHQMDMFSWRPYVAAKIYWLS